MKTNISSQNRTSSNINAPSLRPAALFGRKKVGATLLSLGILVGLCGASLQASDPIGVFALVEKVVLEPSAAAPERIQIWGSFCLADETDPARNAYHSPQKGYLYFKLPAQKSEAAHKEWKDLANVAGTGQIIGFGSRFNPKPTIHKTDDKPKSPESYPVAFGLVTSKQRRSDYGPFKQLLATSSKAPADATSEKK
jgi:hypothetical protein